MPRMISATKPASIFQHLASGDSLELDNGDPDSAGVYYLDNEIGAGIDGFNFADATNHDYEIRILRTRPSSAGSTTSAPRPRKRPSGVRSRSGTWAPARTRIPRTT